MYIYMYVYSLTTSWIDRSRGKDAIEIHVGVPCFILIVCERKNTERNRASAFTTGDFNAYGRGRGRDFIEIDHL